MRYIYSNFNVTLKNKDLDVKELFLKKLNLKKEDLIDFYIQKESVDARHKEHIIISYNIIFDSNKTFSDPHIKPYLVSKIDINYKKWEKVYRPVIVGFGPASIFAALILSRANAKPIIIERGSKMEDRIKDVEEFLKNKNLNESSNIQFGEGGAGTFSDGKLTTNLRDPLINFIHEEFVKYGAPKEIIYKAMPHIGTDYLRLVIKNMREDMERLGATFYFNEQFIDYMCFTDHLEVYTNKGNRFLTSHLILGLGHSARDTLKMLYHKGLNMEAKSFSMGVRIEHKKETINKIQYGKAAKYLDPASYKMAVHLENRDVYTFCMCPGGEVMASQSEKGSIVTNGMSYHDRGFPNSNAALLVNVKPEDFIKDSILDGLNFQEFYERKAFEISSDYRAPANLCKEFLEGSVAKTIRSVKPSYPHGVCLTNLELCLPNFVTDSLREAIPLFAKKMKGFDHPDAVLTGVETRSSCPLRILRDSFRKSSNPMIYPIGEGAGYAGGITSAALDGLKTAIEIMEN